MQGNDRCAAVVGLAAQGSQGHHRRFASQANRFAEMIAVLDVIADHDHSLLSKAID